MRVGGYVGACSAAGGGAASPGPGRAGVRQIFQIPCQIAARSQPDPRQNPTPSFKIDHFALLGKGMSMYVAKSAK